MIGATAPEPFACATAIIAAMSFAGVLHTAWMRSPWSRRFAIPLDGGRAWRGVRIFGDNKTLRGFMVMVPAAGVAFMSLGALRGVAPGWLDRGLWDLGMGQFFLLGCWAGFWFMAGELPNSFFKRRRGIMPGGVAAHGALRSICLVMDRIDSILALLIALTLVVPVDALTWMWVLILGPAVHLAFSAALYLGGVKPRIA